MKTILLIDDDPQIRTMFGVALRRSGYYLIEADSGTSGLAMARQHLPDLILSDIHMPDGDGAALLREIRSDPALRSKQVVLMTGRPDMVTPRKGMEDGADDFLIKPVGLKALVNCVEARFARASINWRVEDQLLAELRASVPSTLPHEFFTPLAGIMGLMELALHSTEGLPPEELRDIHQDVYESALRLHRTLRNYLLLLDLQTTASRAASPIAPDQVEKSIYAGIDDALRINKRRDDLTARVHPCSISLNPDDLGRIADELVDNAFKFSRPGTPVVVEMRTDGTLLVTDSGRGMTPEQIEKIGAFKQFDRKKHEQQGLGLGLALVQKLLSPCGGKLSIVSNPGQGTTVQIAFPVVGEV